MESALKFIELLRGEIDAAIERHLATTSTVASNDCAAGVFDDVTRERIRQFEIISHKPYLDKAEMAVYLDCSERSIDEWSARASNDNPLPVGYVGSHMRGKREKLDEWVDREAHRRRLKLAS